MAASTVGGQFSMGVVICNGMPLTHATYFPFVYCYHIFLQSFRRKKEVMALVVFCLACDDARRGVVQITTGCIAGF
jgi:hypothetical protein